MLHPNRPGGLRWAYVVAPLALSCLLLISGCSGNVLGRGDSTSGNTGANNPPAQPPPSDRQTITLIVTNTGNSNILAGTYPLTGAPNGRFINGVQVQGVYDVTDQGRVFHATFTLANSTNTDLQVGNTVDLSVYRLAYTQTGPGSSFFAWRTRSGIARITAIYGRTLFVAKLENLTFEPDPSAANNDATGTFTVNGDGYVVITN